MRCGFVTICLSWVFVLTGLDMGSQLVGAAEVKEVPPPADWRARRARFARRDDPEQIEALARRLAAMVKLDAPGVAHGFTPLYREGRYAEALDAYRDYVFDKLLDPERHGIPAKCVEERDPSIRPILEGRFNTERMLHLTDAEELMANHFIVEIVKPWDRVDDAGEGDRIMFELGEPGAINWAYVPPFWSNPTPQGPHRLEWRDDHTSDLNWCPLGVTPWARQPAYFARHFRKPTCFCDLLSAYIETGEQRYLDKWIAYIDDWTMNQKADADASPYNIHVYNVQELERLDHVLGHLAFAARRRRQFVQALPAPTLVRFLVRRLPEAAAATVRQTRLFEGNWRYSLIQRLLTSGLLHREFRFSDILLETARRKTENDAVRSNLPDGSDYEATPNYWGMMTDHCTPFVGKLNESLVPWATPAWTQKAKDQARLRLRAMLACQMANGRWPTAGTQDWHQQLGSFDTKWNWDLVPEFFAEPDTARRLNRAFGKSKVTGKPFGAGQTDEPSYQSEWLPYGGWYFLRAGWEPESHHAFMQNNRNIRGKGGGIGAWQPQNSLFIYGHGHELLFIHNDSPVMVDHHRQNKCFGLPLAGHSGWVLPKNNFPTPQDDRWHDSARLAFAEGLYDGAWGPDAGVHMKDWLRGRELDESRKVLDVAHRRQVHLLKDLGLWIVADRVDSERTHVFTQRWHLHVPEDSSYGPIHGFAPEQVDIDYRGNWVKTRHDRGPNVTLYQIGSRPLIVESRLAPVLGVPVKSWGSEGRDPRYIEMTTYLFKFTISRILTHFRGQGHQVVISVVCPRATTAERIASLQKLEGDDNVIGFDANLADGKKVAYRLALDRRDELVLGDVVVLGESLLVTTRSDGQRDVLVLGAERLTVDGGPVALENGNAQLSIAPNGAIGVDTIYRPIIPVAMEPIADVFDEPIEVTLSSATPGVDIRYTLDGSEPTGGSPLYDSPFTLAQTTTVKARAFRKGVTEIPSHLTGTEVSTVTEACYRTLTTLKAVEAGSVEKGLRYSYLEGTWQDLLLGLDPDAPLQQGVVAKAMDISAADRGKAFAFIFEGFFEAPVDGIYTFYSPGTMYDPAHRYMNLDQGYDLQLWVGGRKWYPGTHQHGFGTWSVALARGLHPIAIRYADFRAAKPDLCFAYKENRAEWDGDRPLLTVSGPGLPRQALPARLLWRAR